MDQNQHGPQDSCQWFKSRWKSVSCTLFVSMCISQDPWRALRSKLISRFWYKSLIGFGISGKRLISKSCVNQHRVSLLKKLRHTSFNAPLLRPLLKISTLTFSPFELSLFFSPSLPIDLPRDFRREQFDPTLRWRMQEQQAKYATPCVERPSRIAPMHLLLSKTLSDQTVEARLVNVAQDPLSRNAPMHLPLPKIPWGQKVAKPKSKTKRHRLLQNPLAAATHCQHQRHRQAPSSCVRLKKHPTEKKNRPCTLRNNVNITIPAFFNVKTRPHQLFHEVILFSPKIAHLDNAMWQGVVGARTTYDILLILNGLRRTFKARRSPGVHVRRI